MANIKVGRDSRSSSTRPMPKKTNRDSRAAERQFRAQQGIQTGTVTVRNPSSSGSSQSSSNTQSNVTAARTGAGMQISPMLRTVIDNNPVAANPAQVRQLANNVFSQARNNRANASSREKEQIRTIMATANLNQVQPFGQLSQQQQLRSALENDIRLRERRINKRDTELSRLQTRLTSAENRLGSYDKYIRNGTFTGTDKQYAQYKNAYYSYEKALNNYNRNAELQNLDIKTLKTNQQSIDKKTTGKQEYNKAKAKYDIANKAVSDRLPTVEQVEPYIRQLVKTSTPVGMATQITDRILKRKDTEKIVQFSLGGYESVKQKPLKAAATFVTFAVGGVAVKGLGKAASAIGAGAKTAKAARLIEKGAIGVYAVSSGARYATVQDARQAGFVTGDIIFNELLPAGLGLKYGVKVVESIPKGAVELRVAGIKAKTAAKRVSRPIKATAKRTQKAIINDIRALRKEQFIKKYQKLNEREMSALVRSYLKEGKEPPAWLRKEWSKVISSKSKKQSLSSFSKFLANEKAQLRGTKLGLKEKKTTGRMTQAEFNKLLSSRPTRSKKFSGIDNLESQIYRSSNLSKIGVKNKRTLTRGIAKEIVKNPNRNPRTIIGALSLTNRKTYNSLSMYQKAGLIKAFARFITPAKGTGTVRQMKARGRPSPSGKPATQAAAKAKTTTKTRPMPATITKAKEKAPETIIPQLKSLNLKSHRPKKQTKRSKKGITTTQALNKVATFKDLFG